MFYHNVNYYCPGQLKHSHLFYILSVPAAPAPTGGIFGAPAPAGGMFGGGAAPGAPGGGGTKAIQFTPAQIQDGDKTITMQSISVMPQYERKSFEELRYEDYMQGNKGMFLRSFFRSNRFVIIF